MLIKKSSPVRLLRTGRNGIGRVFAAVRLGFGIDVDPSVNNFDRAPVGLDELNSGKNPSFVSSQPGADKNHYEAEIR
jgi:hypothetical protein